MNWLMSSARSAAHAGIEAAMDDIRAAVGFVEPAVQGCLSFVRRELDRDPCPVGEFRELQGEGVVVTQTARREL